MYLLDTNVISELRKASVGKSDKNVIEWAKSTNSSMLYLSVITILEIDIGILAKERHDNQQAAILRNWLNLHVIPAFQNRIISIDLAIAKNTAKLHVPDRKSDRDALIAATAITHGMTVVTRNTGDFEQTGAMLLNPWLRGS